MRHEMRHHLLSAVRRNLNRRDNRQLRHLSLQTRACSTSMSAFRIRGARGQKQSNPSHPLELLRSCYEQPHGLGSKRKLPPLHAIPPGSVSSQVYRMDHVSRQLVRGITRVSIGSWLCENAAAGSLTDFGCGATTLREVCEQYFSDSSATQPDAAARIVSAPGSARTAKVRARHAPTA